MSEDQMGPKEESFEPIRYMEIDLETAKKEWLQKYGWVERCNFVDSYWRWCKEIDGVLMMCDMQGAINIEYNYLP